MQRFGQIIEIKPERLEEYKKYHREVWPEVLDRIKKSNIRNYSVFYKDNLLFAYFEYTGKDFVKDMEDMAKDPKTIEWWSIMDPMQKPIKPIVKRTGGEWWTNMQEIFHAD